jgi:hypothetical protein
VAEFGNTGSGDTGFDNSGSKHLEADEDEANMIVELGLI